MLHLDHLRELATSASQPIGVGVRLRKEIIRSSIADAADRGLPEIIEYERGTELCRDLVKGELGGAVRGTLSTTEILSSISESFNVPKILRVALMVTADGKPFFLAPVGIDEGNDFEERLELLKQGVRFLECLDIRPDIAVLSKGRKEDVNRGDEILISIEEGNRLVREAAELGLNAEHKYILLEQAVREADYIIAPDGVSGNLIFRALYFLGQCDAVGAPVINLDRIFVDTSREKRDYCDSFELAAALCTARERGHRN